MSNTHSATDQNSEALVTFDSPPVVETALSVQFTGITWDARRFGQVFDRVFGVKYPQFWQLHELPPIVETFPLIPSPPSLNFNDRPTHGRGMFATSDESHLIQIQGNRFGLNWKQASDHSTYPRFATNLERFGEEFTKFAQFCRKVEIGTPSPTFTEVVYVNRIDTRDEEAVGQLFDEVFNGVNVSIDPQPELVTLNRTFVLGELAGRLYAEAGIVPVPTPFIQFKLTSRLRVDDDMIGTLKDAHDHLIQGFVNLTSESCRKERWGQR